MSNVCPRVTAGGGAGAGAAVGQAGPQLNETLSGLSPLQEGTGHESQLLRTYVLPQLPPTSTIRPIGLLVDTGLPGKYPCFGACEHALSPAACQGFQSKFSRKLDAFAFSCPFRPCLRPGLQPFFRSLSPPSVSN